MKRLPTLVVTHNHYCVLLLTNIKKSGCVGTLVRTASKPTDAPAKIGHSNKHSDRLNDQLILLITRNVEQTPRRGFTAGSEVNSF